MTFAEKLPQVLEWVRSHGQRLKRVGFEPPNHLGNGEVWVFNEKVQPVLALPLDGNGAVAELLPDFPVHRLEVRDSAGELLFAEDYPQGLTP